MKYRIVYPHVYNHLLIEDLIIVITFRPGGKEVAVSKNDENIYMYVHSKSRTRTHAKG
jgi:hypothetical protein